MKKVTIILTGVILMTIASVSVNAQNIATDNASASATILEHLTLVKNVDLVFGGIITDTDGGTVVIAATETGTVSYNNLPSQLSASTSSSKFTASGQSNALFAITLPSTTTITNGTPADDMTIGSYVSSVGLTHVQLTGGVKEFYVGATLTIGAQQPAGLYTGSFPVTVTYE